MRARCADRPFQRIKAAFELESGELRIIDLDVPEERETLRKCFMAIDTDVWKSIGMSIAENKNPTQARHRRSAFTHRECSAILVLPGRLVLERAQEYRQFLEAFVGVALLLDVVPGAPDGVLTTLVFSVASRIANHGAASVLRDLLRGAAADELEMKVRE